MNKNINQICLKIVLSLFFLGLNPIYGQNSILSKRKPIEYVDVSYDQKNLAVSLIMNIVNNDKSLERSKEIIDLSATYSGNIIWKDNNRKSTPLFGFFEPDPNSSTPFKWTANIKTEDRVDIDFSIANQWIEIRDLSIKYKLGDQNWVELPSINIFPPPLKNTKQEKLEIEPNGTLKSISEGEILVKSESPGTGFVISKLIIKKEGLEKTFTSKNLKNKGAYDGKTPLKFGITDFNIIPFTTYQVKVEASVLNKGTKIESNFFPVVFINRFECQLIEPIDNYIEVNASDKLSFPVRTSGDCNEFSIVFQNKDYERIIEDKINDLGNGLFELELGKLNELRNNTASSFSIYSKDRIVSGPHIITKNSPKISNFRLDALKNDGLVLLFNLPTYVKKESLELRISHDDKSIKISDDFIERDNADKTNFSINIQNEISNIISNDTIKDLQFEVIYNSQGIYNFGVKLLNQRLIDNKMAELVSLANTKKNKISKQKIKETVLELSKIAESIGNKKDDQEIQEAIRELSGKNTDKINRTLNNIGKWGKIIGKFALMFIA